MDVIRRLAEAEQNGQPAAATAPSPAVASSGSLEDLLQSVARRKIELKPGTKLEDAQLEDDLNLSSLDRVELMSAIENRYQIELSDRDFSEATTVADLENLLKKSVPETPQPNYPYARWAQRWPITWIRLLAYQLVTLPYMMIMGRPTIHGRERLKGFRGPALIVSNHISQIDIGYITAALPLRLRTRVAAAMQGEMLRDMRFPNKDWFFLRRWREQLRYVLISTFFNVFPLPQRAKYRESFRFAGELADRGYSVLIFPEGRRTDTGEMGPVRSGIGLLATH
jgi:long-chain acyl-CoA synthetase